MLCAERGHTGMVDALLSAGAEVCCVDENGNSALHLASFYGQAQVVELLLAVDADVTVREGGMLVSVLLSLCTHSHGLKRFLASMKGVLARNKEGTLDPAVSFSLKRVSPLRRCPYPG